MPETHAAHMRHPVIFFFDTERASPEDWAKFHVYRRLRDAEDRPNEPVWSDADMERSMRDSQTLHAFHRFMALGERGEYIGSLRMSVRREGTPDYETRSAFLGASAGVLRPHRRRGVATALLRELLRFMEERGKRLATIEAHLPEGHAFLRAIGAIEKHRSMENRMHFSTLDGDELARWRARALAPALGLRAEIHAGRVPFERLAPLMAPLSALLADQPRSALDEPPIRYELEPYRTWYADMDRRGGEHFLVLLLDGDEVAAVCDASWDRRFPDRLYQMLTAVAPRWRGQGLAKGVKAALLQLVRERHPEIEIAITSNAESNAPMLAINRQLGFAPYRHDGIYQIGAESLRAFLSTRAPAPWEEHA